MRQLTKKSLYNSLTINWNTKNPPPISLFLNTRSLILWSRNYGNYG